MVRKTYDTLGILYIEDDDAVRLAGAQAMRLEGLNVLAVADAESALATLRQSLDYVIVSDVRLPGMDGLDLLTQVKAIDPEIPVILVTGHGDISMAVRAMRLGAYDFIEKPYASDRLLDVIGRAMDKRYLILENRRLRQELEGRAGPHMIGESPAMQAVHQQIATLADTDVDVLIMGETGTGKELAAKALHHWSRRRDGRFVAINCAGLPETVFESEMFGYEAGAFTGANKRRIGHIEYATGGSLFLDEIESMPMSMQAKLLRVLQERELERLGSNTLVPIDCRVIAATKDDLLKLSDEGRFRRDLCYRLNVVTIRLPPLRERPEDIGLLFVWFVTKAADRHMRAVPEIPDALIRKLTALPWPGNVRELKNMAERYVLGMAPELDETMEPVHSGKLSQQMLAYERQLLEQALHACGGTVVDAAQILGLPRKTLYDKLTRFGIDPQMFRPKDGH